MLSFLRPRLFLVALVVSLPVAASGACGSRTACFQYSQPEYMVNGNSCPAQAMALANFSDPSCPGPIVSVDGSGSFDGQLCCYPVTYDSITPDCGGGPLTGTGGSFSSMSTDFAVGEGVTTTVSTGTGFACSTSCVQALVTGPAPCGGEALSIYTQLQTCAGCFGGTGSGAGGATSSCAVTTDCATNLCIGQAVDGTCSDCLSGSSCDPLFAECNLN